MKLSLAFLLLTFLGLLLTTEAKHERTIAVLSVDAAASRPVADDITTRLLDEKAFAVVERERLNLVTAEQSLSATYANVTDRVKMGHLVGADVLILVAQEASAAGPVTSVVVCDCATGARMGRISISAEKYRIDDVMPAIRETLARFPEGVQTVVTVSDFICRDLGFEYTYLQKDFADLVRDMISRQPGVAVVEINEARSIDSELKLTGGDVKRTGSVSVVGEYRTDRLAKGGPRIAIQTVLSRQGKEDVKLESSSIPLADSGPFFRSVNDRLIKLLNGSQESQMGLDQQFSNMIVRANQFAEIGDLEHSVALRETALLMKPDADPERIRLAREYAGWCERPNELCPRKDGGPDTSFWPYVVARCREAWRRSLHHVEYLVRNRRVNMETGTRLYADAIHSICRIRTCEGQLTEEEELKKLFIRNVAPALFNLIEERKPKSLAEEYRATACDAIFKSVFFRMDGNFVKAEDLELASDLLCNLLPEDVSVPQSLIYIVNAGSRILDPPTGYSPRRRMEDIAVKEPEAEVNARTEAWLKFCRRLSDSSRLPVKLCGQYALLGQSQFPGKEALNDQAVTAIRAFLDSPDSKAPKNRSLASALRERVPRVPATAVSNTVIATPQVTRTAAAPLPESKPATTTPSVAKPVAQVVPVVAKAEGAVTGDEGAFICERIKLKPIVLHTATMGGKEGGDSANSVGCTDLLPAWKNVDVVVSGSEIYLAYTNGLVQKALSVGTVGVCFDGLYAWASAGYDRGIYALNKEGKIVAHVTAEHGLPDSYVRAPLHPLGEGRILAAGSIGQAGRGWLAVVELVDGKPSVQLILEAPKAWIFNPTPPEMMLDPAMRFEPNWIVEHKDRSGKQWIFVDRWNAPLMIDKKTLKVAVYPIRNVYDDESFPRKDPPATAFLSHGSQFYVAGSYNDLRIFELNPQTLRFVIANSEKGSGWHWGATAGSLAADGGFIYYAGDQRWLRYDYASKTREVLVASPRALPGYGDGHSWKLTVSQCHGLVALHSGVLYGVALQPADGALPLR